MTRDRGVTPGIIERNFRSTDPEPIDPRERQRIAEYQASAKLRQRRAATAALDAMLRAPKPKRPPGR